MERTRTDLYVPPEEYAQVEAAGARWDEQLKCWYITSDMEPSKFSRWLGESEGEEDSGITSDEAFVVSSQVPCWQCHGQMEVICIFCTSGIDLESGEPLEQLTLSDIFAMDDALIRQLRPWPYFREVTGASSDGSYFANHCPHCGAMQEDMYLHSEPGDVFFDIPHAQPGSIEFTPLIGRIRLSGDYSFGD